MGRGERVDIQGVFRAGQGHFAGEPFAQEGPQLGDRRGSNGQPRGHGVAAAGEKQTLVERAWTAAPRLTPALRSPRALADIGGTVQPDHHHRLAVALAKSARDDADHAWVPVLLRDHNHRRGGIEVAVALDGEDGRGGDLALDVLAPRVEAIELRGQIRRLGRIVRGEQPRTQI